VKALLPHIQVFPRQTRIASTSHPYSVHIPKWHCTYYGSSFLVRTARLWNALPVEVFPKVDGRLSYDYVSLKRVRMISFYLIHYLILLDLSYLYPIRTVTSIQGIPPSDLVAIHKKKYNDISLLFYTLCI